MLTTKRNPASRYQTVNQSTNRPDTPPTTLPREKPTIAKIASHQRSSRLHLYRARINLSLGRTGPAALAIRRSASHAVTAAARHWHFNAYTKRRLTTALFCLVHDLGLPPGHLETFSQVYSFTPEFLDSIDRRSALLALTRLHHRVHSLVDDLDRAIEANPARLVSSTSSLKSRANPRHPRRPSPPWENCAASPANPWIPNTRTTLWTAPTVSAPATTRPGLPPASSACPVPRAWPFS